MWIQKYTSLFFLLFPFCSFIHAVFLPSQLQPSICNDHYQMGYRYWPLSPILALINWNFHATFGHQPWLSPKPHAALPDKEDYQLVLRHRGQVHFNKTPILFQVCSHYSMEIGNPRLSCKVTYCWLIPPQLVC